MRGETDLRAVAAELVRAEPSRFRSRRDDADRAADTWAGKLVLPPHRPVQFDLERLTTLATIDDNWRSLFASLTWSDVLRRDALARPDAAKSERYEDLVKRLTAADWSDSLRLDRVYWKDHPAGVRAATLAAAVSLLGLPAWLEAELRRTAEHLVRPENYKGWGNHCLMQNSGLLGVGVLLQNEEYVRTAHDRGFRLLRTSVAADGSSTEGSIAYHTRLQRWWTEFRSKLLLAGIPLAREWGRIALMQRFADHATLPDGRMAGFGDTSLKDAQPQPVDPGSPRRSADVGVFSSGYLFARGSSGEQAAQPTYLAMRFGQAFDEAPHGHEDAGSLEWVVDGRRLLTDSGMYKYAQSPWRTWVKKAAAHNVMTIPRLGYDQSARSPVRYWGRHNGHVVAVVDIGTIPGASWRRTVVFPLTGAYLIVIDEVNAAQPEVTVQRWNVPTGVSYEVRRREVASVEGAGPRLRWVEGSPSIRVAQGWQGSEDRPWVSGWRSEEYGEIAPAPAVEATAMCSAWRSVVVLEPPGVAPEGLAVEGVVSAGGVRRVTFGPGHAVRVVEWPDP